MFGGTCRGSSGGPIPTHASLLQVRAWDPDEARDAAAVATLRGHGARITCLAVSRCGLRLASGSSDGHVLLWSAASFEFLARYELGRMWHIRVDGLSFKIVRGAKGVACDCGSRNNKRYSLARPRILGMLVFCAGLGCAYSVLIC